MKTTFGRLFGTAAAILLAALLLLGTFFQVLVKDYLVTNTTEKLTADAKTIAELAAAYNADSSLSNPNFLTNLIISARVSGADAVICNAEGKVVLCSDSPLGCEHQGMSFDKSFVRSVMEQELVLKTGRIDGLYDDSRYVVSVPITDVNSDVRLGLVVVSAPMEDTVAVLSKIFQIFVFVAVSVVLVAVLLMSIFTRRQVRPLRAMAKAATDLLMTAASAG